MNLKKKSRFINNAWTFNWTFFNILQAPFEGLMYTSYF